MSRIPTEDNSDTASFLSTDSDPLSSPTNGYFSSSPSHLRDMYIDTDAANRDTKNEYRVNSERTSPPASGLRYSQERTPLLESFLGQAPPPTYLEATTPNPWGRSNSRPSGDENARLLSFDGRTEPEALSDPLDGVYEGPKFQRRRKTFREHCSRKRMLKWIAGILLIIILAAILAAVTHKKNKETITPTIPAQPAESGSPTSPKKDYPIRWPPTCGKNYNVKSELFDVDSPSEYHVSESVAQWSGPFKRISGWIHVAPAPADQTIPLRTKLAYAASPSVDIESIKYSTSANSLTVGDPNGANLIEGMQAGQACLGISIVLYVKAGLKLENLDVSSLHLGMQIHRGSGFTVTNSTSISLAAGTLDVAVLESRNTRVRTIAGSISGKYALYDLLDIDTKSGSINIDVDPREAADNKADSPALFNVKSLSGSVRADYERKNIPIRDYQTNIDTKVGSVDGRYIHGSKTVVHSVAGYINLDILPFGSKDATSTLDTYSSSGKTEIEVRPPYKASATGNLSKLSSSHKAISGAIKLKYPQEWEGKLYGTSLSGGLHLEGRDLELVKEINEPGKSQVEAKKGNGNSELVFSTLSGECDVRVGKLERDH